MGPEVDPNAPTKAARLDIGISCTNNPNSPSKYIMVYQTRSLHIYQKKKNKKLGASRCKPILFKTKRFHLWLFVYTLLTWSVLRSILRNIFEFFSQLGFQQVHRFYIAAFERRYCLAPFIFIDLIFS